MLKKILVCGTVLSCTAVHFPAFAQSKTAQKIAKQITPENLKDKLSIIAGAEMEGRETATPGQEKAAAYIASKFQQAGLEAPINNGYLQHWPVYQDELVSSQMLVYNHSFEKNVHYALPQLNNVFTGTQQINSVVFVGFMDDSLTQNVSDKWVVVAEGLRARANQNAQTSDYRSPAPFYEKLRAKGAKGVLVVQRSFPYKTAPATKGNMYVEKRANTTPFVVATISETLFASVISNQSVSNFANIATLPQQEYATKISLAADKATNKLSSSNVLGVVTGKTKPNEYVIITAHYDHLGKRGNDIYYGADDDGSGTAAVVELAEAFAKAKKKGDGPERSVIFMAVSGEEKGLWGSKFYSDNPVFPLDKTSADLNIDMIGRIDPSYKGDSLNYVFAIGEDKISSDLQGITDSVNKLFLNMEVDRRYNDPNDKNRFYFRSDHYNFARKGVPVIFYFNGVHADYHRPTDTVDKINFPLMAKRTQLVFLTAWEMANRPNMLVRDKPIPTATR